MGADLMSAPKKRLLDSIFAIFPLCCGAWCDSKANPAD
jgi:hypothetical protein